MTEPLRYHYLRIEVLFMMHLMLYSYHSEFNTPFSYTHYIYLRDTLHSRR